MPHALMQYLQPRTVIVATAVVALAGIGIAFYVSSPSTAGAYVSPTQGQLVQEVDATGAVKAAESVDLSFQLAGRIASVSAQVGTSVGVGTQLASLSNADLAAQVEEAKAALQVQQAKLGALNAGARPESVAVGQAAVTGAETSLSQANISVVQAAQNAYVNSDDAIHNKIDAFFTNPRTTSPSLAFDLTDSQLQNSIISGRISMESLLTNWQSELAALAPDTSSVDAIALADTTRSRLQQVSAYLDGVASGLTKVITTTSVTASVVQGYQTSVATARTNISAALSSINSAETTAKAAQSALASARSQLALTQAPATTQDVEAQNAQVAVAQAALDAAEAQLAKSVLRAPFSGLITENDAHIGETATPGVPLISMISDSRFQIEIYVSEADLTKIQLGDDANVSFDAYPGSTPFPAQVVIINPAATVENGVSAYKVTLQFKTSDPRIRAGLTGNVRIITQTKDNVLSVPTSAIVRSGDQTFVLRKTNSGDVMTPVQTGISSADGRTEITSGLSLSDSIRTFGAK